jgi:hypothetical protein
MKRLRLLVLSTCLLFLLPGVASAGSAISYSPASPTTTTGVSFTVTTGGGNRDFTSIQVACVDTTGTTIYATTLTVVVSPKGTGTSATIYPPASTCTANLVKLNQIGSARVLATTGPFTVGS